MTAERLAQRAGSAVLWQAGQLFAVNAVNIVNLIVLTRLLTPEDFGLLAMGIASVELLAQATDLGLTPALVQRGRLDERHYDAAWTVGAIRAVLLSVAAFFLAPVAATIYQEPRGAAIVAVLAIRPVLYAAASMRVADLIRRLEFRSLALLRLSEALAASVVSIALAHSIGVWGLVIGALAGPAVAAVLSYRVAPYRPRVALDRLATLSLIGFGRWILGTAVLAAVANLIVQVVVTRQLGAAELGLYVVAARLAYLASEALGEVVGAVAFSVSARLDVDVGQASTVFRALLVGSSAVLYPILAITIAIAPSLGHELLGPRWAETTSVIRILAVCAALGLLGDVTVPLYKGLGRPQVVTALEAAQSLIVMLLIWPCVARYGLLGAALAWLPAVLGSQLLNLHMLSQLLGRPFQGLPRRMAAIITISIVGAIGAFVLDLALPGIPGLVCAASVSTAAAALLLFAVDRRFNLELAGTLTRVFPATAFVLSSRATARAPGHDVPS